MAVKAGDFIEATAYNNYVMGLAYAEKVEYTEIIKAFQTGGRTVEKFIWMRGARTDKDLVALPVPYTSYNTFHINVNRSLNTGIGTEVRVNIDTVTWDLGGTPIYTPVSGSPFRDTSFFATGTDYYRFFVPGYYRVQLEFPTYTTLLLRTTRSAFCEFKPWQNQVEAHSSDLTPSSLRSFESDRSGLMDNGVGIYTPGREFKASKATDALFADPFYLGGNHPDYTGD